MPVACGGTSLDTVPLAVSLLAAASFWFPMLIGRVRMSDGPGAMHARLRGFAEALASCSCFIAFAVMLMTAWSGETLPLAGACGVIGVGSALLLRSVYTQALRWAECAHGRCVGCGYDLAGLDGPGVCPECGETRAS